jgi:hypothetical protein
VFVAVPAAGTLLDTSMRLRLSSLCIDDEGRLLVSELNHRAIAEIDVVDLTERAGEGRAVCQARVAMPKPRSKTSKSFIPSRIHAVGRSSTDFIVLDGRTQILSRLAVGTPCAGGGEQCAAASSAPKERGDTSSCPHASVVWDYDCTQLAEGSASMSSVTTALLPSGDVAVVSCGALAVLDGQRGTCLHRHMLSPRELAWPIAACFDKRSGHLVVVDQGSNNLYDEPGQVVALALSGQILFALPTGPLEMAQDVTVDADGRLLIADHGGSCVVVLGKANGVTRVHVPGPPLAARVTADGRLVVLMAAQEHGDANFLVF